MTAVPDFTIEREIVVDAPVEVVWRTVTEPDQIVQWFADGAVLNLRAGGEGRLVFVDQSDGQERAFELVVEEVERPHRFSYRWGQAPGEVPGAANSVLVEFTLRAEGESRTRLRVCERGLEDLAWSDEEKTSYADDHRNGWAFHFDRIARLLSVPTS